MVGFSNGASIIYDGVLIDADKEKEEDPVYANTKIVFVSPSVAGALASPWLGWVNWLDPSWDPTGWVQIYHNARPNGPQIKKFMQRKADFKKGVADYLMIFGGKDDYFFNQERINRAGVDVVSPLMGGLEAFKDRDRIRVFPELDHQDMKTAPAGVVDLIHAVIAGESLPENNQPGWMDQWLQRHQPFTKGGIDFNGDRIQATLQIKHEQGVLRYTVDPAMLKQLRGVGGLEPVILDVRPLKSLPLFLGLADPTAAAALVSAR